MHKRFVNSLKINYKGNTRVATAQVKNRNTDNTLKLTCTPPQSQPPLSPSGNYHYPNIRDDDFLMFFIVLNSMDISLNNIV